MNAVNTFAEPVSRPPAKTSGMKIGLLTGGQDRHYAYGLATALAAAGMWVDVVGGDEVDSPELHEIPNLHFLNLRGTRREDVSFFKKSTRVLVYYARLLHYAWIAEPKIFHILWNNKFEAFDRTFLMLFYRAAGRRLFFTAHNVNAGRRDGSDSALNRITLGVQYRLCSGIFVHTEKMKAELVEEFGVAASRVVVIPYGINNAVPDTSLTTAQARAGLGIRDGERTILFFGAIVHYKGLDTLIRAFALLPAALRYRLIIAGKPRGEGSAEHLAAIRESIARLEDPERVLQQVHYIADEDIERYFKAADVIALPYREIFQSGIFFLAYSFGLPVVASDVGSFREDVVEGRTGYLCQSLDDPQDLAQTLERYFESDLYRDLSARRQEIRDYAIARHSWATVARITCASYAGNASAV